MYCTCMAWHAWISSKIPFGSILFVENFVYYTLRPVLIIDSIGLAIKNWVIGSRSIHFYRLSRTGSWWQQAKQVTVSTSSWGLQRCSLARWDILYNLSSVFLVYPGVSHQLDVPRKPPKEGTQEASWSHAQTTLTGSFDTKEQRL